VIATVVVLDALSEPLPLAVPSLIASRFTLSSSIAASWIFGAPLAPSANAVGFSNAARALALVHGSPGSRLDVL
jgi:hypothetical protein